VEKVWRRQTVLHRAFVGTAATRSRDGYLSIITLAERLLNSCLRAEGCHEAQGFLFSQARLNCEIVGLLRAQGDTDVTVDANVAGTASLVA
jgi:hypothetical protein